MKKKTWLDYDVNEDIIYNSHIKNREIILEFAESGKRRAEIKDYPHIDAKSCRGSFAQSIKKCNMTYIKVSQRNDRVFLINTLID